MRDRLDGVRLMVVDDHEDGRELLTLFLTMAGAHVAAFVCAADAFTAFELEPFDAIVCDLYMPVESGETFLRRVRASEQGTARRIPAVAISASPHAGERERCTAAGFDAFLERPFEPAELVGLLADRLIS